MIDHPMYRTATRRLIYVLACAGTIVAQQLPLRVYSNKEGLAYNQVQQIFSDSAGFLWFCTDDGLGRFDGSHFVNIGVEQGMPYPAVNDMIEIRRGIYWIATNGGGVVKFDANTPFTDRSPSQRIRAFKVSPEPATNRVNVLFRSRNGVVR